MRTKSRFFGVGLAAVLLLSPIGIAAAADVSLTQDERDAMRFRADFGLESGVDVVRRAADDPTYSSDDYGYPLSEEELQEMFRRAGIQASLGPAIGEASAASTYAGAYIDQHARGVPVFLFTDDPEGHRAGIEAALSEGTEVRVGRAERANSDLFATQARIEAERAALRGDGIDVISTGIWNDERNTVVVGVADLTADDIGALQDRYGNWIEVQEAESGVADCSNAGNCRPIKGGLRIETSYNSADCTSGFIVRRADNAHLTVLTAGHCIEVNGGTGNWEHNSDVFGEGRSETWLVGGTRNADVGLVSINDSELPSTANEIHVGGGTVKKVVGVDIAGFQLIGDQAIRFGEESGNDSGVLVAVNVSRQSCVSGVGCMTVSKSMEVNFDSTGGDSGGPYFYPKPGGTSAERIALGTHVHSETDPGSKGWYSPYDTGRDTYLSVVGYAYSLCITASC